MMNRYWLILLAVTAFSCPAWAVKTVTGVLDQDQPAQHEVDVAAENDDDTQVWEKADRQFRASYYYTRYLSSSMQGRYAEAAGFLRQAAASDPESVSLQSELAEHYEVLGLHDQALLALQKAVKIEPANYNLRTRLAHLFVRLGKLDDARAEYEAYLSIEPGHRESLHALASLAAAQGQLAEAVDLLDKLLAAYPDSFPDLELKGDLLARLDRSEEAAAVFASVLDRQKDNANAWYRLALLHEDAGRLDEAERKFSDGLLALPGSFLLLDGLARFYYRHDHYEKAEETFELSHLSNPLDEEALLFLGMARLQLKKNEAAELDFLKVAELQQEESASQLYGLGLALVGQKKNKEAENVFRRLVKSYPRAVSGFTQLALLTDQAGRDSETVDILKDGIEKNPLEHELYLLLGAAYLDQKEYKKGEKVLLEGMETAEKKGLLRFQLAALYDKSGKFEKAEKELLMLIDEEPENAQALNYLGYSWAERGEKLKEAEALVVRAIKKDPLNHYYLDSLGWIYYKQEKFEQARIELEKAAARLEGKLTSDDAVILDHLGDVLAKMGKKAEATRQYKSALEVRPDDNTIREKAGLPLKAETVDAVKSRPVND